MVSQVINSLSRWWRTNYTAECCGNLPQRRQDIWPGPTRTSRMQAWPALKPSEDSPEYEAGQAQTKVGAGGGPAEERTCARGRALRRLKIRESRTRM